MIIYCGLRHFYIRHFKPPTDTYYILTHNKKIWDFSPELKNYRLTNQTRHQAILHLDKPVLTLAIDLKDFAPFAKDWHAFSRQYTHELEVEYPHAWYLRFKNPAISKQFLIDFSEKLQQEEKGGIWGAGQSKLVAKLAAHNLTGYDRVIAPEQTKRFLDKIPLHRLPLLELAALEKLGIKTIGELGGTPLLELSNQFGKRAEVLHKLGRGEDLVSFQAQQAQEHTWGLDFTTLDGFLRPVSVHELKPYLKRGIKELASKLKKRHKMAGEVQVETHIAQGTRFEKKRQLKATTDDPNVLTRAVESLLPNEPLAQINVVISKLEASPLAQLTMFWEPQTPKLSEELPTQTGVELPRRERLLLLWEECFT